MEQKDKDIMKSLNEFVLYSKNWYKHSDDIREDIMSLLKPTYSCMTKRDVTPVVIDKWSEWNETLPNDAKLTVVKFWRELNHYKDILRMVGENVETKSFDELTLNVIINHIAYTDPKYINIYSPFYKKGKLRYGADKEGMTYLEMNYATKKTFEKYDEDGNK